MTRPAVGVLVTIAFSLVGVLKRLFPEAREPA